MQYPADYTIELKDGTKIPLLFNYWAFVTYGERKGVEYEDLAIGCFIQEDGTPGPTLRKNKIPGILLIGAECFNRYNSTTAFPYSDLDACLWAGQLTWDQMKEIGTIFTSHIARLNLNELQAKADEGTEEPETVAGEKKS